MPNIATVSGSGACSRQQRRAEGDLAISRTQDRHNPQLGIRRQACVEAAFLLAKVAVQSRRQIITKTGIPGLLELLRIITSQQDRRDMLLDN